MNNDARERAAEWAWDREPRAAEPEARGIVDAGLAFGQGASRAFSARSLPTRARASRLSSSGFCGRALRRLALASLAIAPMAAVFGGPALGQAASTEPERSTFVDAERVTAIDSLVGMEPEGLRRFTGDPRLPRDFDADDLRVSHGGKAREVVAAEPVVEGRPQASEPWTFVVFVDAANSRTANLRWAAGLLAERAEEWVALGSMEVVVADPDVRLAVPSTRESRVVKAGLSKLALEVEGRDALADLRYSLRSGAPTGSGPSPAVALELERARVLRHQDELLAYLARRWSEAGPRRCLIWLTGGFDIDPERFYDPVSVASAFGTVASGQDPASPSWPDLAASELVSETEEFARTLAAHGWITVPMVAPPPDPLRGKGRGARAGKLRFLGPAATYEADRRPERAEAYLELASAHRAAGRFQDAADAYDRAYYYFWGDPATKERQAVALAGLGAMLERLGEHEPARKALEMAVELDPGAVPKTGELPAVGRLHDPLRPLREVARATSGRLIRARSGLRPLIDDLKLRLRVTYQVAGEPTGELEPVAIVWQRREDRPAESVPSPRWSRLGAPARLDRALARVALEGAVTELGGGVAFGGREVLLIEPLALEEDALRVALAMGWPANAPRPRGLRLTVAASAETHLDLEGAKVSGPPLVSDRLWPIGADGSFRVPVLEPPVPFLLRGRAVAVVWRDLDSGAWGGVRHPTGLP